MDAFFAACLSLDRSGMNTPTPGRASSAKATRGKDLVQALGLSKEQYKALSLLPFSSSLGLEDAFSPQGIRGVVGQNEALLRSCKVNRL
jgi:hypothetical protein